MVKAFRRFGYDLSYYNTDQNAEARRQKLIESHDVGLVLDVGANHGQFGCELREVGFRGKIVSFEPIDSAFQVLKNEANGDSNWIVNNYALGDREKVEYINISKNSESSSLLPMLEEHLEAAPQAVYISKEEIQVRRLDDVFSGIVGQKKLNILLKIDTQGYEEFVLAGAKESLSQIDLIQVELSLTPLYEGAPDLIEMLNIMNSKGYTIVGIDPVFSNKVNGKLLQADFTFLRKDKS